jgi:hypothetical protein
MTHLATAALVDANTGAVPNNSWGVGKLRIDVVDPTATVAAPNGGELLITGYPTDIIWTAADPVWTGVSSVDIQLSRDNGVNWAPVAMGIANTGLFTWTPTGPSTYVALIKVTAHDGVNNTGSDVSNAVFAIDNEVVANELPSFLANNTDGGVNLSWRFADAGRYVQSWVERASNAEFARLDAPINVTADGFNVIDKTALAGVTYQYRIAATESNGAEVRFAPVSISANNGITEFALGRAFPNPTATGSTIAFAVPRTSQVSVKVFDVAGRLVSTLADQQYNPGHYEVTWNGRTNQGEAAANGVYFVHFVTPTTQLVQRVMIVK